MTTTTALLQGRHLSILRRKAAQKRKATGCTWAGTAVLSLSYIFAKSEGAERTQFIFYLWIRTGGPQKPRIYKLEYLCNEKTLCEESGLNSQNKVTKTRNRWTGLKQSEKKFSLMRKTKKSEALMGRKQWLSGGIFHRLKGKPRLFPSLHGVQTVG